MIKQHEYLEDITKNIESGHYQPTTTQVFEGLSPENLYQASIVRKTINDWEISN